MRAVRLASAAVLTLAAAVSAQPQPAAPAADLLERVGVRVAEYYSRARTVLGRETVRLQPLDRLMRPAAEWRQLVYDVRIDWDPMKPGEPSVARQLVTAGGRLGALAPSAADCFDLQDVTTDALAMLLPERQKQFEFVTAGDGGERETILGFRPSGLAKPIVTWRGDCVRIDLQGHTAGRVWLDRSTAAVIRIDERLVRPFPFFTPHAARASGPIVQTVERVETSVRYEPVAFRDPDETLMLPVTVRTLAVIENSAVPRLLTLQSYGNYRRFMTGARVVK